MNSKVSGKIKFKDYLLLELYHQRKGFLTMIFIAIIIVYVSVPKNTLTIESFIMYYIYVATLGTFLVFLITFIRVRRNYKSLNKRFHEKIVQIDHAGILYGSRGTQKMYRWSDIKKTVFFKKNMFLYISEGQAMIIPNYFFSSSTEEKEWIAFIKQHVSN